MGHKFYLRRDQNNGVERWTLYEAQRRGRSKLGSLRGWRLSVALPYIRKTMQGQKNIPQTDPAYRIPEEEGVRLALAFLGIRNLMKLEKAENLCRQIQHMSQEEAYYWYARSLTGEVGTTGLRALRILFGTE